MPTAFLIQPLHRAFEPVRMAVTDAVETVGLALVRPDSLAETGTLVEQIIEALGSADLVIADVSEANPNVMYELGFVHGTRRPVILISSDFPQVPFDIASLGAIHYGHDLKDLDAFRHEMEKALRAAVRDPAAFSRRPATRQEVNRLFISYSHRDRAVLERLLVHLKPLEREGLIDVWNDTRIEAGSDWKREVEAALGHARAAILLVTADFLASDFIVNDELPPLLHSAESKGTAIIPVIVKPCRYTRDARLRRLQAINDPAEPLLGMDGVQQERLLDQIAMSVERAMRPLRRQGDLGE
jgi:TIR domain